MALLLTDRPLIDLHAVVAPAAALGIAVSAAALVALRWVSDRLKDSEYGRLVRSRDPKEAAVSLPFLLVASSGVAASLLAIITLVVMNELTKVPRASLLSLLFLSGLYSVRGVASLVAIGAKHQQNSAEMQHIREELERDLRDLRRTRDDDGPVDGQGGLS